MIRFQLVMKICSNDTDFRCDNGACINLDKKCDLVEDCTDGSDESKDACGRDEQCLGISAITFYSQ